MTVSETHPRHTSWYSVILCHGYVLLFMLKILGTIKCAHAPFRFFFFFFLYSRTNAHTHAQSLSVTHTHRHTHIHNTSTTFMPCDLARHYANGQTCHLQEISETQRGREGEIVHICQFVRAPCQV